MRTRKEIEASWKGELFGDNTFRPTGTHMEGLMLEVLLDIRDLLDTNTIYPSEAAPTP